MPRGPRLDAPGALHHVIQRGVDRGRLFRDTRDYEGFVARLGRILTRTGTGCYAWCLMPNHLHLLMMTGGHPLPRTLQCLFTSHAVWVNRRYRRSGHLFQGRYRSVLCQRESYLLELVRYIHLNPVRARLVRSIPDLARYRWTGHRALLGMERVLWQDTEEVLGQFSNRPGSARAAYVGFLKDGVRGGVRFGAKDGRQNGLTGADYENPTREREETTERADPRILGSRTFVERVLKEAGAEEGHRQRLRKEGWKAMDIVSEAAKVAGITPEEVRDHGKRPAQCLARCIACKWLVDDFGASQGEVAKLLQIGQSAVSVNVWRGREAVVKRRLRLVRE